jgi:electron-transferring-flavoprotein dehydrogenase
MPEREVLDVDILIVGAGPAGLATAYHLGQLLKARKRSDLTIAVLEKGKEVGAHIISGAVIDPRGIEELIPDWRGRGAPIENEVDEDAVYYLTQKRKFGLPIVPPPLKNHGNVIISLNRFTRWLGSLVEESGVDVFAGFSGAELLYDNGRVVGVRTGDKGVDRNGSRKGNYEPGIDIRARMTILAEGARGSLTKQVVRDHDLDAGSNPQVYSVGVKEVWEVPSQNDAPGRVVHTMGYPLSGNEFGGGFIYNMAEGLVSVGLVVGLDYLDPGLDPHSKFQQYKEHPFVGHILAGGHLRSYGAKAIPEGGYWSMPRQYFDGGLIVGDGGGFLNSMRLKGIHLAIKSGMLAAETAVGALEADNFSALELRRFEARVEASWIKDELWKVRNFHQGFEGGFWSGLAHAGIQMLTGGRGVRDRYLNGPGHERMQRKSGAKAPVAAEFDGMLTFDKLTDVYNSGTAHEEDQPSHLVVLEPDICHQRCTEEFGNPCQYFCPAAVYSMEPDAENSLRLQISASNCVHCKTCDIMDPYQVIEWRCPEGGGGPGYEFL